MKISIQRANQTLIFLFFGSNILLIIFIFKITNGKTIDFISLANIFLNIVLITFYLILNQKYRDAHKNLMESFKETMKDESSYDLKSKTHFFLENKEMETLFKKSYIKNNLLKKDLKDLHSVFEKFIPADIFKTIGFR
jgi:hypothetical protein